MKSILPLTLFSQTRLICCRRTCNKAPLMNWRPYISNTGRYLSIMSSNLDATTTGPGTVCGTLALSLHKKRKNERCTNSIGSRSTGQAASNISLIHRWGSYHSEFPFSAMALSVGLIDVARKAAYSSARGSKNADERSARKEPGDKFKAVGISISRLWCKTMRLQHEIGSADHPSMVSASQECCASSLYICIYIYIDIARKGQWRTCTF